MTIPVGIMVKMQSERGMEINLGKHCELSLEALEAILPITDKAGIISSPNDAYDEWETIVQAIFEAFVVLPICDATGKYAPNQFLRMGFDPEKGKLVVSINVGPAQVFVSDLVKGDHGIMRFEVRSLQYPWDIQSESVSLDQGLSYSVSIL